jgi:cytochrome c-type protein NapC
MTPLGWITLISAGLGSSILIAYLLKWPPLTAATRVWLFFGLGVLPLATSFSGAAAGLEITKKRSFCASCHVMEPWANDAASLASKSLAAIHSRNAYTGRDSCYVCHADYSMFGPAITKLNGIRHVWHYYATYRDTPLKRFVQDVELYAPYPNSNCTQCHSLAAPAWNRQPDHAAIRGKLETGVVSCVSAGCHGSPHPFKAREEPR